MVAFFELCVVDLHIIRIYKLLQVVSVLVQRGIVFNADFFAVHVDPRGGYFHVKRKVGPEVEAMGPFF